MTFGSAMIGLVWIFLAAAQAPSASSSTIAAAVLPLPDQLRTGATVVRLDSSLQPELLRRGTNGMVCIADAPTDSQFDVRCYRDTFIPVVYRAFQLGYRVSGEKVGAEIKAGKIKLFERTDCRVSLPWSDRWLRCVAQLDRCSDRVLAIDSLPLSYGRRHWLTRRG